MILRQYLLFIALILFSCMTFAEQTEIRSYKDGKNIFWDELYRSGTTLYCNKTFNRNRRTKQGDRINIEHVVPAKSMTILYQCGGRKKCRRRSVSFNYMEADLHNMYPTLLNVNSDRGSFDFGEIPGNQSYYSASKNSERTALSYANCDFELKAKIVEPQDNSKGNIARVYFYMMQEYGLQIDDEFKRLLQKWNRNDLPLAEEIERNDKIECLQGTRNLFIDQPKLADNL